VAWAVALQNKNKPTALLLSRQNLAYAPKPISARSAAAPMSWPSRHASA
jgi:transketolase